MDNNVSIISKNRTYIMGLSMIFIMMSHQPFLLSVPFKIFHVFGHFGVDAFFFNWNLHGLFGDIFQLGHVKTTFVCYWNDDRYG